MKYQQGYYSNVQDVIGIINGRLDQEDLQDEERVKEEENLSYFQDQLQAMEDVMNSDVPSNIVLQLRAEKDNYNKAKEEKRIADRSVFEQVVDIGENVLGALDVAATIATGATTGFVTGGGGGSLAAVEYGGRELLSGMMKELFKRDDFKDPAIQKDFADFFELRMTQGLNLGTWSPKTQKAKEWLPAIAEFLAPLEALPLSAGGRASMSLRGSTRAIAGAARRGADEAGLNMLVAAGKITKEQADSIRTLNSYNVETNPQTIIDLAKGAARGKPDGWKFVSLASQVDPEAIKAADNLGILQHMQFDHITTNLAFKQLTQVMRSITGSALKIQETEAINAIGKNLEENLKRIGLTTNLTDLSDRIKLDLERSQNIFDDAGDRINNQIVDAVGNDTRVTTPNFRAMIEQEAIDAGGFDQIDPAMLSLYKRLYGKGDKEPTFYQLERVAKKWNTDYRERGEFDNSTLDDQIWTKAFDALRADRKLAAESVGLGKEFELQQSLFRMGFEVTKDLKALFAKETKSVVTSVVQGRDFSQDKINHFKSKLNAVPERYRNEVFVNAIAQQFMSGEAVDFKRFQKFYEGVVKGDSKLRGFFLNELTGDQRKLFENMNSVVKVINDAAEYKERTGRIEAPLEIIQQQTTNFAQKFFEGMKTAAMFSGEPVVGTVLQVASKGKGSAAKNTVGEVIENILLTPEFKQLVTSIGTPNEGAAIKRFTQTRAGKMKTLLGIDDPLKFIERAIVTSQYTKDPDAVIKNLDLGKQAEDITERLRSAEDAETRKQLAIELQRIRRDMGSNLY